MAALLGSSLHSLLFYAIAISILVAVHEFGHFWVARRCGVAVEVFSIGFGREVCGFTDRRGTRWKLSALPFGGYVKFLGDQGASSAGPAALDALAPEARARAFAAQPVWARAAIAAAGPVANFILAAILFAGIFVAIGQPYTPAVVGAVVPDSAAAAAGIAPGDRIKAINGGTVDRFEDLQMAIRLNRGTPVDLTVERDGRDITLPVTPKVVVLDNGSGGQERVGQLGISRTGVEFRTLDPLSAVWAGTREVGSVIGVTATAIGQMVTGARGTEEIGGPLRIADLSGQVARLGLPNFLLLIAALSVNLGLFNLLPVPMLDGGHLLYYAAEAVKGRPLSDRLQEYGLRIGLAMVLSLMVFATWNDIVQLKVVDLITRLFT